MQLRLYAPRVIVALIASITALVGNVYAQELPEAGTQNTSAKSLPNLFSAHTKTVFQEKVYIHQDKDSYLAGETMWMRAYRTDASTLSPYYYSGLMYIEIRDPENKLMHRMQIIRTDTVFQASYKIPPGWPSGFYELVAYTNWMQNFDDDFYFKKRFYVFNTSDNNVTSKVYYTHVPDKNKVDVKVKLQGVDGGLYPGAVIDVTPYANGKKLDSYARVVNKDGEITLDYKEDARITGLNFQFENDKPIKYERYFKVPILRDSIDVQFMPEGGHLLAGVQQQVGFKAVAADGKGVEVKGQVKDSLGNMVGFFESQHLGMGRFAMQAEAGAKYSAEVTTGDGRSFTFPLPAVADTGVVVNTSIRNNVLTCRVQGTPNYDYTGLGLAIHSRGRPIRWVNLQEAAALQLPMASLPEGILQCFVVDQAGTVLSERIVLVNKDLSPEVQVAGIKPSYGRRQKVELELDVVYGGTQHLPSDLSVAVLDTRNMVKDKSENIVSYLLMSSDIKGKIENPAFYFDKSIPLPEREAKADILMMTQAWKRFDVDSIFRGKVPNMPFTVEQGQYLAGKVKPLWGKSTETGRLLLLGINQNPETKTTIFRDVTADTSGFFQATDIAFPKNTTFVVQGMHKGAKKNVEVIMEEQKFAGVKSNPLVGRSIYVPEKAAEDEISGFYQSRGIRYFYENGERIFALDAAVVTARVGGNSQQDMYDDASDNRVSGTQLLENGYSTIRDWLESVGVVVRENEDDMKETVYIRNTPARIWVDNQIYDSQELLRLPVTEVADIWVFKDPISLSMVTLDANAGADQGGVVVATKSGFGLSGVGKETTSFFKFTPLGYSVPAKFYSPKYDEPGAPTDYDERVTVYWDPKVKTNMSGKAKIEFYTTDAAAEYLVVVEGMAGSQTMGIPIHKEFTIKSGM